jgi:pilus assembly protein CpaB
MEGTMGRRTVLLLAALVVAALGTTMVILYVNGVNNRADAKQSPEIVQVAKHLILPGTSYQEAVNAGDFDTKTINHDDAIAGAISDLTPIKGLAANTTIYPGDQITRAKFGEKAATSTLPVPSRMTSISVQFDDPAQAAGFVAAGTYIAIFFTGAVAKGGGPDQTQLLLPKVQVLAIGNKTAVPSAATTTTGTETDSVPKTILTLAVDQKDYQRVLFASTHGHLNLGLLGKDFTATRTVPPTTQSNLFN